MDSGTLQEIKDSIRTIADYPKPGVQFRDITTLLGNARAFRRVVDELVEPWTTAKVNRVAGIEARGFILGGAVAHQLAAGFVPEENSIIGNTVGVNSLFDGPGGGIPGSHNSLSTQTTGIMVVAPAGPPESSVIDVVSRRWVSASRRWSVGERRPWPADLAVALAANAGPRRHGCKR